MAASNNPNDESVERTEVMPRAGKIGGERLPRSINSPMKGREERYVNRAHTTNIVGQKLPKDAGLKKGGEAKGKTVRPSRGMGDMSPSKMPKGKTITRKDSPDKVSEYAKGGKAKLNIKKAIKKPGALHAQLGVPKGEKIPASKIAAAAKKPGKLGQRARFAQVLSGVRKKK